MVHLRAFPLYIRGTTAKAGADPGGWILGDRTPPPAFGGAPNFMKEGKNVARVCADGLHFSTYSYVDPPFQNPVSAPAKCIYKALRIDNSW